MGLNRYESYNKKWVDQTTDKYNDLQLTEGERAHRQETAALVETMSPMPGAENQPIGVMQIESGEAHKIMSAVRDLARQHPDTPARALDLGTFTGHSALAMANGMKEFGGKVITCDFDNAADKVKTFYEPIARRVWEREGVNDIVDYRRIPLDGNGYGGAQKLLDDLVADSANWGTFDAVFIDENKVNYEEDVKKALLLLRPGGKMLLDNMLWSGRTTDHYIEEQKKLREENAALPPDQQKEMVLVDGVEIWAKEDKNQDALRALNEKIAHKQLVPTDAEAKTAWQQALKKELKEDGYEFEFDNSCDGIMILEKGGFAKRISLEHLARKDAPGIAA